ncbi:hypothetical protein BJ742DRAFT_772442 [Cladochytrium replicatum]|nr:hypothetical protein BJ742DRAFT_772442 [Cladochytrium replicatum]
MGLASNIKKAQQNQAQATSQGSSSSSSNMRGVGPPTNPPPNPPQFTGAPPPYPSEGSNPFADQSGRPPVVSSPTMSHHDNDYLLPTPTSPRIVPQRPPTVGRRQTASGSHLHNSIKERVRKIAQVNNLSAFYSAQSLEALGSWICQNVDFEELSRRWNMPLELALDLACLSLYDIVIYADDSGSMIFEEGGSRIDDLKFIATKVAEVATLFDQDGISMRFMKDTRHGDNLRTPDECDALISSLRFAGMTPLGTALEQRVLRPFVLDRIASSSLKKPVLIIIITDGEPVGEPRDKLVRVLTSTKETLSRSRYGAGAIGIQIAQVGKDQRAQRFLSEIDNHPIVGRYVDVTSYYELEEQEFREKGAELTPELWLLKLMVGGIDPEYDDQDE